MNKKMFIICAVFALILSCKNYASSEDLKQKAKEQVKGFLETKKEEFVGGLKKLLGSEAYSKVEELMQADGPQVKAEEQVAQGVSKDPELKEIEKKIEELKEKINKSDDKTPLGIYSEYEKEIKSLNEKLNTLTDKDKEKKKLENGLKELEKALKDKIEKRKKELEAAKNKFQELKEQVETATGQTNGDQVKNQGKVGVQAWQCANKLGLNGNYSSSNGNNTNELVNRIIDGALKKIDEELKNIGEEAIEGKKE